MGISTSCWNQSVSWAPNDSLDRSQETKSVDSFDKNGEFVSWSPYMSIFGPQETSCRSKHVQSTALVVFPGTQETTLGPQETTAGITAAVPWERRRVGPALGEPLDPKSGHSSFRRPCFQRGEVRENAKSPTDRALSPRISGISGDSSRPR